MRSQFAWAHLEIETGKRACRLSTPLLHKRRFRSMSCDRLFVLPLFADPLVGRFRPFLDKNSG